MLVGSFGLREAVLLFYISLLMGLWRNNFGPGSEVECFSIRAAVLRLCMLVPQHAFYLLNSLLKNTLFMILFAINCSHVLEK